MPVYKQFKYYKIRDCPSCRFFKFGECHQPCPNDFNCNFITNKAFQKKYYFKTSILGRVFIRRGFKTKEAAREAESIFRKEMTGSSINYAVTLLPTYKELLDRYADYLKQYKITYYIQEKRKIKNFFSDLFPDIAVNKLLWSDAEKARKKIDSLNIKCITKNSKLYFVKRFFKWVEKHYRYKYQDVFTLNEFKDYTIHRQKKKAKILEFDQFNELYHSCDSSYYQLMLLTMFLYGFRISEQLGLTVDSFDFEDNTLEIYHAVTIKGKRGVELITPKTPAGERIQSMPLLYAELVKKHIEKYNLKDNDFIFFRYSTTQSPENHQLPVYENTCRRALDHYCKQYNPDFHPHMLRTSICTHLREKGVPIEEISRYLGHENPKVTKEYYSKVSMQKQDSLNYAIDDILKKIL